MVNYDCTWSTTMVDTSAAGWQQLSGGAGSMLDCCAWLLVWLAHCAYASLSSRNIIL